MIDLLIWETGNGGDLLQRGNDIVPVTGYENTPYLALFGGSSWWGNYLVPENQFLSRTEEVLRNTTLTSAGRIAIENALGLDLAFLKEIEGTTYSCSVTIAGVNKLSIEITINGKVFSYNWNPDEMYLTYIV